MSTDTINAGLNYITYGLYLITASDGEKHNGLIVNTAFQVTAEPPQIAVSVNKESLTHALILKSGKFAAMPLRQSTPMVFIGNFGFRTGKTFDKFAKVAFETGALGCPIVRENTLSFMEAQVCHRVDAGSHTLFIGLVKNAGVFAADGDKPLTYDYYHTVIKGKTPKGATHL